MINFRFVHNYIVNNTGEYSLSPSLSLSLFHTNTVDFFFANDMITFVSLQC